MSFPQSWRTRFAPTDQTRGALGAEPPAEVPVPLFVYLRHDLYIGCDGVWENLTAHLPPSPGGVTHQAPVTPPASATAE